MAYASTVNVYPRGPGLFTMLVKLEDVNGETLTIDPDDPAGDGSEPSIPRRGRILAHRHELQDGAASMSPRLWVETDLGQFIVDTEDAKVVHGPDEPPILYDCLDGVFKLTISPQGDTPSLVLLSFHLADGWGTEHQEDQVDR